jgi:hypothetical protein
MRDDVPIGVMRHVNGGSSPQYYVLGVALVSTWDAGYFYLEGFSPEGFARPRGPAGQTEAIRHSDPVLFANMAMLQPDLLQDARRRVIALITLRQGQGEFRKSVLAAYEGRCTISGCDAIEAVEAAHITPYAGPATIRVDNGLALRADLHTLFDHGLIAVAIDSMSLLLSRSLESTIYAEFGRRPLGLPREPSLRGSLEPDNALQPSSPMSRLVDPAG